MDIEQRFAHAAIMAEHYTSFKLFAEDGMVFLGFALTDVQADIAEFMEMGPRLRMVMAQRGEAKSTLAALYAVWRIMQRPSTRVLIISGGETQASEVATLVIRIIMRWDIFEYLRPDKAAGDKTSVEGFDIHYVLRGTTDKSPSVACVGITANLQGKRADLLIPDDVETTKNGLTMTQRGQLMLLTREFSSICTHGDILYLGTPQTKDSIYNTLPGRGFVTRIWPGRYPTPDEMEKYGDRLAPLFADRIRIDPTIQTGGGLDGKRGKPTDPERYNEDALIEKELDQGPEGFQLQYMLDTSLADAMRQQLKLSDLMIANFDWQNVPEVIAYRADPANLVQLPPDFVIPMTRMYHPANVPSAYGQLENRMMYIDPAGGGPDEIGFGVSGALGPYIHVLDAGGLRGGLDETNGKKLIAIIKEFGLKVIRVESNMGHGLFEMNLLAMIEREALTDPELKNVGVLGEYSTGQKERRIIDSMVSAMQRHRIIFHQRIFESDIKYNLQHTPDKRLKYSLFSQMSNITTDRNSLEKDDRIEAVAGCIRYHKHVLLQNEEAAAEARRLAAAVSHLKNPMGYDEPPPPRGQTRGARGMVNQRRNRK